MADKYSKIARILYLYEQLCTGKLVSKSEAARRFGVDERSIQRDIDDIRAFLDERVVADASDTRQVIYDRRKKGFLLSGYHSPLMTNSEILAVSKILLESRAFTKTEMSQILDKLIAGCVPSKNMKLVTDLLANEEFHYIETSHPAGLQEKLWEIGEDIQLRRLMKLSYTKQGDKPAPVTRIVEPVSILFSEYYFYLLAYIVAQQADGGYAHKYDYPAVFRVDRIDSYTLMEERFSLPYANRFQEGEFRKRVQFMYPGRLEKIRFRYTGESVDAILDRLPTAKLLSQTAHSFELEAEVYGKGIIMWLLSQGERVEVLSPGHIRAEMRNTILNMLELYR